jgi:hypothetical protein
MFNAALPSFTFEKVSFADARLVLHPAEHTSAAKHRRSAALGRRETLTGNAAKWILNRPSATRPLALARQFPRIANELAETWGNPPKFKEKLTSYLIDDRTNRLGFPLEVAKDLMDLKEHFDQQDSPFKMERRIVLANIGAGPQTDRPAPSVYKGK